MPWSVSERCRVDPQPHCMSGELSGKMVWRGGVGGRSGPLRSGAPELTRAVTNRAEAGRQAQLRRRARLQAARAGLIGVHQGIGTDLGRTPGYQALRGGNGAQAVGTDLWMSSLHKDRASACRASHCGRCTLPLGRSKGLKTSGPLCMARCAVAAAARYAATLSVGLVWDKPRRPWQWGRVTCAVRGPSSCGRPRRAKTPSTPLLSAR
jgi:hypothetical protein